MERLFSARSCRELRFCLSFLNNLIALLRWKAVRWRLAKGCPEGTWLASMLARKPRMLVVVALANKMARMVWAMLTKLQDYRTPALAA